ncbi:UNC93-like protein MFSD11 isoform X1 [Lycorma delicatula]|uniref:UNC93-like protein MFSD11 isoform X1 n=1 Tax=Lycorma delicatula TaxID=130591 RepID=UPI003F50DF06
MCHSWKKNSGTFNVIFMSFCFFVLFTSDMTVQNMEKTIISSIHDDNKEFQVDGYDLLAFLYIAFGISLWLGPSFVNVLGQRTALTVASSIYTIYIASFTLENVWAISAATAAAGVGAGLIWTAEGKYLISNSKPSVISRNIGIFWTLFCSSSFLGNLFTYFTLNGKKYVDQETRRLIISSLAIVAAFATILFAFLRPVKKEMTQVPKAQETNAIEELKKTWRVFITKDMLLLNITFCFTGLQQAFQSGIYSPSLGFTLQFGHNAKQLVPLSGIFVGIGQLLGGCFQILQGQRFSKLRWIRSIFLIVGIAAQFLSFALIYINIPSSAVFGNTNDKAIIESNVYLAIFCSLLLGIGDGCLNTQNFSIIAVIYPDESAQSCALYKFTKAVFVAVGFSASSHLNLHWQITILAIMAIFALFSYIYVDMGTVRKVNDKKDKTSIKA